MKKRWRNRKRAKAISFALIILGMPGWMSCTRHERGTSLNLKDPVKSLDQLVKPTDALVISSIKTIRPLQKTMDLSLVCQGTIRFDPRRLMTVPAGVAGRVMKLTVKYNWQRIRKGQKILEIESPELSAARRELIYLLKSDGENTTLLNGAREKLRQLGMSDAQINQLSSTMDESSAINLYSPVDGFVIGDDADSGNESTVRDLRIREGMYVRKGQVIFSVINTLMVLAEFDLYDKDAPFVSVGDTLKIMDQGKELLEGRISQIQPAFKGTERFVKLRAYLPNAMGQFRIGQQVTASVILRQKDLLWIPVTSRMDLGDTEIVFRKRNGAFKVVNIVTGRQSGEWLEVVSGLSTTDSIAYQAQFMIGSESLIKTKD